MLGWIDRHLPRPYNQASRTPHESLLQPMESEASTRKHPREVQISSHPEQPRRRYSSLISLWIAIYAAGMFTPPLLDDVDTIHAEAAREMLLPPRLGDDVYQRHPLSREGAADVLEPRCQLRILRDQRLEHAPCLSCWAFLRCVLATYRLGSYAFGERGGFYSGRGLATSIGPYIFTRFLIPDVLVGLWLAIAYLLLSAVS